MSTAPILYSTEGLEDLSLDPVAQAVADIAAGRPIVVVDDEDRENEGDLVVAAEKVTPEIVAFMMSECRGLICAPMEPDELERLELPQMVQDNTESMKTAFTVSVDASAAQHATTRVFFKPALRLHWFAPEAAASCGLAIDFIAPLVSALAVTAGPVGGAPSVTCTKAVLSAMVRNSSGNR